MKNYVIIIGFFCAVNSTVFSKERQAPNAIFLELAGNAIVYSVNYDRMLSDNIGGRIGLMLATINPDSGGGRITFTILPLMANYLYGGENHKIEVGIGFFLIEASTEFRTLNHTLLSGLGYTSVIGYRYQPVEGGYLFRVGYTPFIFQGNFTSWLGISAGVAF